MSNRLINILALLSLACGMATVPSHTARAASTAIGANHANAVHRTDDTNGAAGVSATIDIEFPEADHALQDTAESQTAGAATDGEASGGPATSPSASAAADPGSIQAGRAASRAGESRVRALELERVEVSGNSHVSDSAILNTLDLAARDTVNVDLLEAARLRLLSEQPLLNTVDFSTRPGSSRGLVILDIAVTERNPVVFETGYGHHDIYGWFLTLLGLRVDPAAAYGTEYHLGLRLGFHIAGLDGGFEHRGKPGGFGWGGNFHLYSQDQIFFAGEGAPSTESADDVGEYAREFRQKIDRAGAEFFLLYRLHDGTRFTFGYQAEAVRPDSSFKEPENGDEFGFAEFPQALKPDIKHTDITGLFFRVVRDTRDRPDYPRSGSFSLLRVQSNSTAFGGNESFAKAEFDIHEHIGLGNWRVLSGRLAAGITSRGTPYYERFYLGGAYSVRGFRGLSLSPPSGNDGFVIAGSEFRIPLIASAADVPPRLTGLIFIDAGIGWNRDVALELSDIQAAAGYGVRLRLPWIGTLGLDMGIPFTDGRTGDQFYVNGCVGFSF